MRDPTPSGAGSAYLRGFATNLANPKALVFFAAILAPFIDGQFSATRSLTIIATLLVLALAWFTGLAVLAGHPSFTSRLHTVRRSLDLIASALFIVIGVAFVVSVLIGL